jgi:acyl dehydratase
MKTFHGIEELEQVIGTHLGFSEWRTITQEQITHFAQVTGDMQWIHVDAARAAQGPFGATIAHGYLTLSLIPQMAKEIWKLDGPQMMVNYGLNRVRFPTPVPVDSRVRAGAELIELTRGRHGAHAVVRFTVELDGHDKPACVAESINAIML